MEKKKLKWKNKRCKTPTVLQMEAVECGAASLAMIMGYHGKIVPLEELRQECGVSRDGSKASNVLKAARKYGFVAKGFRKNPEGLREMALPMILFWNFNHFVVLEGIKGKKAYINDPASGQKTLSYEELDQSFTGVVLTFEPGPEFKKSGKKPGIFGSLKSRLKGVGAVLTYVILAGLFLVIPGLVVPTFLKIFVDEILVKQMSDWFKPLLVGMLTVAAVKGGLTWLQEYYLLRFETKLALASSAKFFLHVLRLPVDFFAQRFSGEISQRVQINDKVAKLLSGELATNSLNVIMIVFYGVLMFQYDVVLTLLGVSIAFLNLVTLRLVSRKRENLNRKLLQEHGKLMGTTLMGLHMIETLKAGGTESDFFSQWSGYHAKVMNAQQEMGRSTLLLTGMPPLLSAVNNVLVLAIGGFRVMDGHLSIGMLVAFQSLMSSFISPVNQMVNLGGKLQEAKGDMNRLDDVLKYPADEAFQPRTSPAPAENASAKHKLDGNINIQNLDFGYSRLDPPLIEQFSLTLRPGDRVALVGGSGSGKSTIAKVVSGLYRPWAGSLFFDGKAREEYPGEVLTNSIAMVDQEIFMFEGTIRDNLCMWDHNIPESRIVQAAKDAFIHDDIAARPGGYDSKMEEGGANFSGGQRQRLEIARALVMNPSILILDEATSALDPVVEQHIDERLRRRGCTSLIIAHRLSTIRDCDEIIVLDRGKVVQRGTHDEMAHGEGAYAELIKSA